MAGRLGALLGARRVYIGGLVLVAIGSSAGPFAPSVGWLMAAYVLIGIGMASHLPNAMTIIRGYGDRYHRHPRSAIMVLAVCSQCVAAFGPTMGGLLVGVFGWQSIMWINLPVVVFSAVVVSQRRDIGYAAGPSVSGRKLLRALDIWGVALFLLLITATMVFSLSLSSNPIWWLLPICVLSLGSLTYRETHTAHPFIDVRALVHNRALSVTLGRTLLTYTAFYCAFFGIPQWLQAARGMGALEAGLTMAPLAAAGFCSTLLATRTYRRFGARRTLAVGTVALLAGGVLLALVERSSAPLIVLLSVAAILGVPIGFNNIGNQNLISSVTSFCDVGTAIGMYRTVQYVGANLAVVTLQIVAGPAIDDAGINRAGWFIAVAGTVLPGVCLSRNMDNRSGTDVGIAVSTAVERTA
jgi:MFS family permease